MARRTRCSPASAEISVNVLPPAAGSMSVASTVAAAGGGAPGSLSAKVEMEPAASRAASSGPEGRTTEAAGPVNFANAAISSRSPPQCEWWSSSTLVTAATSGASSRKLPSLSSASATIHSPAPQPALAGAPSGRRREAPRRAGKPVRHRPCSGSGRASPRWWSCRARPRPRSGAGGAELGEELPAVDLALAALAGAEELDVVVGNRGRDDDVGAQGTASASWPISGSMPAARRRAT